MSMQCEVLGMKSRLISHYILNTITREMNPISLENLAVIMKIAVIKTLKIIQSTVIWRAKIFVCSIFSL